VQTLVLKSLIKSLQPASGSERKPAQRKQKRGDTIIRDLGDTQLQVVGGGFAVSGAFSRWSETALIEWAKEEAVEWAAAEATRMSAEEAEAGKAPTIEPAFRAERVKERVNIWSDEESERGSKRKGGKRSAVEEVNRVMTKKEIRQARAKAGGGKEKNTGGKKKKGKIAAAEDESSLAGPGNTRNAFAGASSFGQVKDMRSHKFDGGRLKGRPGGSSVHVAADACIGISRIIQKLKTLAARKARATTDGADGEQDAPSPELILLLATSAQPSIARAFTSTAKAELDRAAAASGARGVNREEITTVTGSLQARISFCT